MLIAQITDIHVCATGVLYKGVADSNKMLGDAIAHLHQLDVRPDLVLVTGDLTDEGRVAEYELVVPLLNHHPPFISGIGYLDAYRYLDAEPLKAVIARFNNIEAILVGHVHRGMVHRWAGTVVLSCPSTTTEIALQLKADAKPQSFLGPPACMLHLWDAGRRLVSHTSYIGQYEGPYHFF